MIARSVETVASTREDRYIETCDWGSASGLAHHLRTQLAISTIQFAFCPDPRAQSVERYLVDLANSLDYRAQTVDGLTRRWHTETSS